MSWPIGATRAEILRILEINAHIFIKWEISREETEAILALLGQIERDERERCIRLTCMSCAADRPVYLRDHPAYTVPIWIHEQDRGDGVMQEYKCMALDIRMAEAPGGEEGSTSVLGGTRQVPRAIRFYGDEEGRDG